MALTKISVSGLIRITLAFNYTLHSASCPRLLLRGQLFTKKHILEIFFENE